MRLLVRGLEPRARCASALRAAGNIVSVQEMRGLPPYTATKSSHNSFPKLYTEKDFLRQRSRQTRARFNALHSSQSNPIVYGK